jgi:hypothetical protein
METKISIIILTLWAMTTPTARAKYHLHQNKLDYVIPHHNQYQELLKTESNFIDHGPRYPIKPIKLKGHNAENLDWIANTLHDNDNYQLQDLSFSKYGMQYNDGDSNSIFETNDVQKTKQTQRKDINSPFRKKGKEKKKNVMEDRKQVHSTSYISNKMKNANMSANYMKKKKNYYNKQKYKYDKKKKSKQQHYGWMKYMKP